MVAVLLGCSGKVAEETAPADAAADGSLDGGDDVAGDAPSDPAACMREADKLAVTFGGPACTTTVRVSQIDLSIVGWATVCGKYAGVIDEKTARAALGPYPKYITIDSFDVLLKGSSTTPWIFSHPPGDFGGIGAVDARSGMVAFYTSLSWSSLGEVALPKANGSPPFVCTPTPRVYQIVSMTSARPSTHAAAVDAVGKTPILRGLERVHAITGITLLHAPIDGSYGEPGYEQKNEWVALIGSALLE